MNSPLSASSSNTEIGAPSSVDSSYPGDATNVVPRSNIFNQVTRVAQPDDVPDDRDDDGGIDPAWFDRRPVGVSGTEPPPISRASGTADSWIAALAGSDRDEGPAEADIVDRTAVGPAPEGVSGGIIDLTESAVLEPSPAEMLPAEASPLEVASPPVADMPSSPVYLTPAMEPPTRAYGEPPLAPVPPAVEPPTRVYGEPPVVPPVVPFVAPPTSICLEPPAAAVYVPPAELIAPPSAPVAAAPPAPTPVHSASSTIPNLGAVPPGAAPTDSKEEYGDDRMTVAPETLAWLQPEPGGRRPETTEAVLTSAVPDQTSGTPMPPQYGVPLSGSVDLGHRQPSQPGPEFPPLGDAPAVVPHVAQSDTELERAFFAEGDRLNVGDAAEPNGPPAVETGPGAPAAESAPMWTGHVPPMWSGHGAPGGMPPGVGRPEALPMPIGDLAPPAPVLPMEPRVEFAPPPGAEVPALDAPHPQMGPSRFGEVVVVFGCRGGAGATTIATNMAGQMARMGREVCLLDLDLQLGDVMVTLDADGDEGATVASLARDSATLDEAVLKRRLTRHHSGLYLISQGDKLEEIDATLPGLLPGLVARLRGFFDTIVVDGVRDFGEWALAALDVADVITLVVTQDVASVRRACRVIEICRKLGYADSKLRVVLNRHNRRSRVRVDEVERALKMKVHARVTNGYKTATAAQNDGRLLSEFGKRRKISRDLLELSKFVAAEAAARHRVPEVPA